MDPLGIHARPAALMIKTAAGFSSDIRLNAKGKSIALAFMIAGIVLLMVGSL